MPSKQPASSHLDRQPDNTNSLRINKFNFQILKLPHVEYFTRGVTLPSLSMDVIPIDYPFRRHSYAPTKLNYSQDFSITFEVDEDLENYREIQKWMVGVGFPDNFGQYQQELNANAIQEANQNLGDIYSDARLLVYTNHLNKRHDIIFEDIFPMSLTDLTFTTEDATVINATVTFAYSKWMFEEDRDERFNG